MTEHDMQASIIAEVNLRACQEPQWSLLFAIPNGGDRDIRVAARLKSEGVRRGVPDLCWPLVRGRYSGLFMELKIKPNRTTAEQNEWLASLRMNGYYTCVVYDDPAEAIRILDWYYEGAIS